MRKVLERLTQHFLHLFNVGLNPFSLTHVYSTKRECD